LAVSEIRDVQARADGRVILVISTIAALQKAGGARSAGKIVQDFHGQFVKCAKLGPIKQRKYL
jgi:hypothetical protein